MRGARGPSARVGCWQLPGPAARRAPMVAGRAEERRFGRGGCGPGFRGVGSTGGARGVGSWARRRR